MRMRHAVYSIPNPTRFPGLLVLLCIITLLVAPPRAEALTLNWDYQTNGWVNSQGNPVPPPSVPYEYDGETYYPEDVGFRIWVRGHEFPSLTWRVRADRTWHDVCNALSQACTTHIDGESWDVLYIVVTAYNHNGSSELRPGVDVPFPPNSPTNLRIP